MKKGLIITIVIVVILGIGLMWGISVNNGLNMQKEDIAKYQAEIDNQLKRRADLIPDLVNTVKGLSGHELDVINSITDSREKMQTGNTQDRLNANAELSKSINILVENYPQIKSDTAYLSLMDELAGTANRITVANKNYNDNVNTFNKKIITFPTSMIAGMFGHEKAIYLEVSDADKTKPEVKF